MSTPASASADPSQSVLGCAITGPQTDPVCTYDKIALLACKVQLAPFTNNDLLTQDLNGSGQTLNFRSADGATTMTIKAAPVAVDPVNGLATVECDPGSTFVVTGPDWTALTHPGAAPPAGLFETPVPSAALNAPTSQDADPSDSPGPAASPTPTSSSCPDAATLLKALQTAGQKLTNPHDTQCFGDWAVSDPWDPFHNDTVALFHDVDGTWTYSDRTAPCAAGQVPAEIRSGACDSG